MSIKIGTNLDFEKNQSLNRVIQNLASAPSNPVKGLEYFDTTENKVFVWNGVAWISGGSEPGEFEGVVSDTTLRGAGTASNPLGIAAATLAEIAGKQNQLTQAQLDAANSGITATILTNALGDITSLTSGKLDKSSVVAISSSIADTAMAASAKSVWDLVQDVIATIPAGGLKIPISIALESQLPTSGQLDGDYYFVQDMDITAPGHTGRAWWNLAESSTAFMTVIDQYQSMDGTTITQTGGGSWEVNKTWLDGVIGNALAGYALANTVVSLTGNQTISGQKTFTGTTTIAGLQISNDGTDIILTQV